MEILFSGRIWRWVPEIHEEHLLAYWGPKLHHKIWHRLVTRKILLISLVRLHHPCRYHNYLQKCLNGSNHQAIILQSNEILWISMQIKGSSLMWKCIWMICNYVYVTDIVMIKLLGNVPHFVKATFSSKYRNKNFLRQLVSKQYFSAFIIDSVIVFRWFSL